MMEEGDIEYCVDNIETFIIPSSDISAGFAEEKWMLIILREVVWMMYKPN